SAVLHGLVIGRGFGDPARTRLHAIEEAPDSGGDTLHRLLRVGRDVDGRLDRLLGGVAGGRQEDLVAADALQVLDRGKLGHAHREHLQAVSREGGDGGANRVPAEQAVGRHLGVDRVALPAQDRCGNDVLRRQGRWLLVVGRDRDRGEYERKRGHGAYRHRVSSSTRLELPGSITARG